MHSLSPLFTITLFYEIFSHLFVACQLFIPDLFSEKLQCLYFNFSFKIAIFLFFWE